MFLAFSFFCFVYGIIMPWVLGLQLPSCLGWLQHLLPLYPSPLYCFNPQPPLIPLYPLDRVRRLHCVDRINHKRDETWMLSWLARYFISMLMPNGKSAIYFRILTWLFWRFVTACQSLAFDGITTCRHLFALLFRHDANVIVTVLLPLYYTLCMVWWKKYFRIPKLIIQSKVKSNTAEYQFNIKKKCNDRKHR